MKLGWVDLGDGAGISASVEGDSLTLGGSLSAGGGNDALIGHRAAFASLRSGQILPLYSLVTDKWPRPELDGVYRIEEAGLEHTATVPWGLRLQKLSGPDASKGTISGLAQYRPWYDGVELALSYARMGVPGSIAYWDETLAFYDTRVVLDEGIVRTVAWNHYSPGSSPYRTAHVAVPKVSDWLAGSPRIQVFADGHWWSVHGQPPTGLPVRVHNGRIGVLFPTLGGPMQLFTVSTAGVVSPGKNVTVTNCGPFAPSGGVRVTQASTEIVRIEWAQHFTDTSVTFHQRASVTIRRGADHVDYRSAPFGFNLRVEGNRGGDITDTAGKLTGAWAGDFAVYSGNEVTVSTPVAGSTDYSAAFWWCFGLSENRGRAWVSPRLGMLRG